jgi:hypothetical protein
MEDIISVEVEFVQLTRGETSISSHDDVSVCIGKLTQPTIPKITQTGCGHYHVGNGEPDSWLI